MRRLFGTIKKSGESFVMELKAVERVGGQLVYKGEIAGVDCCIYAASLAVASLEPSPLLSGVQMAAILEGEA